MDLQFLGLVGMGIAPVVFLLLLRRSRRGLDEIRQKQPKKDLKSSRSMPDADHSSPATVVPHGDCSHCQTSIALNSIECERCGALFGDGSAYIVKSNGKLGPPSRRLPESRARTEPSVAKPISEATIAVTCLAVIAALFGLKQLYAPEEGDPCSLSSGLGIAPPPGLECRKAPAPYKTPTAIADPDEATLCGWRVPDRATSECVRCLKSGNYWLNTGDGKCFSPALAPTGSNERIWSLCGAYVDESRTCIKQGSVTP